MEQQTPQQPFGQQPMQQNMPPQQFNQQQMPQENPGKTLSIVALVLGIVGLLLSCVTAWYLGLWLSIAALVCGIMGRNQTPQGMPNGMAVAGIVLGVVGILTGVVMIILMVIGFAVLGDPELMYLLDSM